VFSVINCTLLWCTVRSR